MNTFASKTQENKKHPIVAQSSRKTKGDDRESHFADNRPATIVQRKLNEMANNRRQSQQAVQLKAILNNNHETTIQLKDAVIQRNKHWKRFLNVASLGIRKAYTHNKKKKMANAAQNVPVPVAPVASPMDQFVNAYEKSRYYQQTNQGNLPSIEEHGLLNYEDRVKTFGEDVRGMSSMSKEYEGDEKKGVFLGPKHLMRENRMTTNVSRAFMPAERTKIHPWTKENEVPRQEMYLDEKFRGGAVITKDSIPPEQVTTRNMQELLDEDDPKLQSILGAVGSQYEGNAPDIETMKGHLREAILRRRLSNAAFDNL